MDCMSQVRFKVFGGGKLGWVLGGGGGWGGGVERSGEKMGEKGSILLSGLRGKFSGSITWMWESQE